MIFLPERADEKYYCYASIKKIFENTSKNGGTYYTYILSSNETITDSNGDPQYIILQNGSNVPKKEFSDWQARFIGKGRNKIEEEGIGEGDFIGIKSGKIKNTTYKKADGSFSERKAELIVFDFDFINKNNEELSNDNTTYKDIETDDEGEDKLW